MARPILPSFSHFLDGLSPSVPVKEYPRRDSTAYWHRRARVSINHLVATPQILDEDLKSASNVIRANEHKVSPCQDHYSTSWTAGSATITTSLSPLSALLSPTRLLSPISDVLTVEPREPTQALQLSPQPQAAEASMEFPNYGYPSSPSTLDQPLLTRNGNPRKRLARACDRCRGQKIRCFLPQPANETDADVHALGCRHCVRLGLRCAFETSRGMRRRQRPRRTQTVTRGGAGTDSSGSVAAADCWSALAVS